MRILAAALVLMMSHVAFAQSRIVSIDAFDLSYTGGLMFKHDNGKGEDRDETTFRFNLNYAQNLKQYVGMMWKAKAYFNRIDTDWGDSDALESSFGAAGGILYNFNARDIKNSYMAGVLVGIERSTLELMGADDESGFNFLFELEGGKRWDLGQYSMANISYAPTVSVALKRYGGGIRDEYLKSGSEIKFNFLKFDILF